MPYRWSGENGRESEVCKRKLKEERGTSTSLLLNPSSPCSPNLPTVQTPTRTATSPPTPSPLPSLEIPASPLLVLLLNGNRLVEPSLPRSIRRRAMGPHPLLRHHSVPRSLNPRPSRRRTRPRRQERSLEEVQGGHEGALRKGGQGRVWTQTGTSFLSASLQAGATKVEALTGLSFSFL